MFVLRSIFESRAFPEDRTAKRIYSGESKIIMHSKVRCRLTESTPKLTARIQFEVFIQFFVGVFDERLGYIDDPKEIAMRNLTSFTSFWFDCVTSIPWSYIDMHQYLVHAIHEIKLLQEICAIVWTSNSACLDLISMLVRDVDRHRFLMSFAA
jgi:hypothetical protein